MMEILFPDGIGAPTAWLIMAVVLAIAEIALPGVFLIWIAAAAALTGIAALLLPLALAIQVLIFAILCAVCVFFGRRWYDRNPGLSSDPLLNDRAARLIGRTVTVSQALVGGEGRVSIDDGSWAAIGPDAPVGARMAVVSASGATLTVDWPAA